MDTEWTLNGQRFAPQSGTRVDVYVAMYHACSLVARNSGAQESATLVHKMHGISQSGRNPNRKLVSSQSESDRHDTKLSIQPP